MQRNRKTTIVKYSHLGHSKECRSAKHSIRGQMIEYIVAPFIVLKLHLNVGLRGYILFSMFLVCLDFSFAQKVVRYKCDKDGNQSVIIDDREFKIGGNKYRISLSGCQVPFKTRVYLFSCSSFSYLSSAMEILLKFDDGGIINLHNFTINTSQLTVPGSAITIGGITSFIPSKDVDYYMSSLFVGSNLISKIENHKIVKIRIFDGINFIDKEYSPNSLGKFIRKSIKLINEKLDHPQNQPQGIYDGF